MAWDAGSRLGLSMRGGNRHQLRAHSCRASSTESNLGEMCCSTGSRSSDVPAGCIMQGGWGVASVSTITLEPCAKRTDSVVRLP